MADTITATCAIEIYRSDDVIPQPLLSWTQPATTTALDVLLPGDRWIYVRERARLLPPIDPLTGGANPNHAFMVQYMKRIDWCIVRNLSDQQGFLALNSVVNFGTFYGVGYNNIFLPPHSLLVYGCTASISGPFDCVGWSLGDKPAEVDVLLVGVPGVL